MSKALLLQQNDVMMPTIISQYCVIININKIKNSTLKSNGYWLQILQFILL